MGAGVNVRVAHELAPVIKKAQKKQSILLFFCAQSQVCWSAPSVFCFSGRMLSMMNTKPELIDQAILYMKIYSLGMPAMAVYNFGNGVLSAIGDTETTIDLPFHCRCGQCSSESVFCYCLSYGSPQALQQPAQFLCISLLLW